jgi:hypothetical protein
VRYAFCGIAVLLINLFLSHQVGAEEWTDRAFRYRECAQDGYGCRTFGRPRRYYSRARYRPYRQYGREYRRPEYEYGRRHEEPRCKNKIIEAVGFEYANVDTALKSTQLVYAATVRMEFGELYQQIEHARDVRLICTDASVNDTAIGKLGESLFGDNAVLKRCKIWARPCRSEIEHTSFAKDGSRTEEGREGDRPRRTEEQPPRKRRWFERFRRQR